MSGPVPTLVLYTRPGCGLCTEARARLDGLLDRRAEAGLATATVVERDITSDPELERRWFDRIPVIETGDRRLELVVSPALLRRFLAETLDAPAAEPAR